MAQVQNEQEITALTQTDHHGIVSDKFFVSAKYYVWFVRKVSIVLLMLVGFVNTCQINECVLPQCFLIWLIFILWGDYTMIKIRLCCLIVMGYKTFDLLYHLKVIALQYLWPWSVLVYNKINLNNRFHYGLSMHNGEV